MMRIFFLVMFAANIVLTLVSWVILPDNVAIHFGSNGVPDGWAPVWFHALLFLGFELALFVTIVFGSRLSLGLHSRWVNLPNKDYWTREENLPKAQERLASTMTEFGTVLMVFLFVVGILTVKANLSNPVRLDNELFWPCFLAFMAYVAYWCLKVLFLFRVPPDNFS